MQGAQGAQGAQGVQGVQGAQGIAGVQGPQGVSGGSQFYDIVDQDAPGLAPSTAAIDTRSVFGFQGPTKEGTWVIPVSTKTYPVGTGYGMYPTITAAIAAVNLDPPTRDARAVILIWPGLYVSNAPYVIPSFVDVVGVSKFSCELYNETTNMFEIDGDNVQFTNFLIRGAPTDSIYAFDCNNHSAIHIRYVDMLHNNFLSKQKFLRQVGSTWAILFMEYCIIDSYRLNDYCILLTNQSGTDRLCDVIINEVFCDTFHLTNFGGSFQVQGCKDVRFRYCTIRGNAPWNTGIRLEKPVGFSGIPQIEVRHCYLDGGVPVFGESGTNYYLINTDAIGSTTAGTRTMRNSSV